jgi:serine/threonine protein kinase
MTDKLCKTCGKAPLANHAGSVTSYFFQHNYCQCKLARSADLGQSEVCVNCGKSRPLSRRAGSFTSFLFKELRCQCAGPVATKRRSGASSHRSATAQRLTQRKQFTQSRMSGSGPSDHSSAQRVLPANSIIGGAFKVIGMVGQGGMGVVYLVEQLSLKKQLALKVLSPEFVNEQSWLRFQAEAKTLASLNHATLVKVYDLGIHDRALPFYSMDYLQGQNLEEILIADGPLPLNQALSIFVEVLSGLAYAHRNGIIHRDLKPSNIMLSTAGSAEQVKILDFGISKLVLPGGSLAQSLTSTGEVFGSPYYMSPEQCVGDVVDARSDIYSIGCSLFEVLTGFVPFEGRSSVETVAMHQDRDAPRLSDVSSDSEFPPSVELVLSKCLAKLPQDRYQTAKELSLDLERILDGKDVLAYNRVFPSAETHEEDSTEAFPFRLVIAVTLLLLACLIATYFFIAGKPPQLIAVENTAVANQKELATSAIDLQKPGSSELEGRLVGLTPGSPSAQKTETLADKNAAEDSGYDSFVTMVGDADHSMGAYSGEQAAPTGSQLETEKYSTKVVVNGVPMISFKFPTDVVIGKIYTLRNDPGFDAKGTIVCRQGAALTFMPSRLVGKYPQYVQRFRSDDLRGVLIYSNGGDDSVLKAVTGLPDIEALSVMANSELTPLSITSFNKFRNLRTFDASSSYLTGSFFASANCWSKLANLYWNCAKAPAAFLKKLQSSPELRFLKLSGSNLSHEDYLLIAKLASLRELDLANNKIDKEDLLALTALDKLTTLRVQGCHIGPDSIAVLKKFKSLIDLEILTGGASDPNFAALRTALPGVRIH